MSNDDEWEARRTRAILRALQTGRPVFADTDGEMRYGDGAGERLADEVGVPRAPVPEAVVQMARAARASHRAAIASDIAVIINLLAGVWLDSAFFYVAAGVASISAVIWYWLRRSQLAKLRTSLRGGDGSNGVVIIEEFDRPKDGDT